MINFKEDNPTNVRIYRGCTCFTVESGPACRTLTRVGPIDVGTGPSVLTHKLFTLIHIYKNAQPYQI